jgi:hypothetical protein
LIEDPYVKKHDLDAKVYFEKHLDLYAEAEKIAI